MSSFSDNAILTKIRAMYGKRLKEKDYQELIRRQTVGEIAAYLKTSEGYRPFLAGIQESAIHRGQLENLLRRSEYTNVMKLERFDKGTTPFFHYVRAESEIRQILLFVSLLNCGRPREYLTELPGYLIGALSFDLQALARAESYSDMLRALEHTPYYKLLARMRPGEEGTLAISRIEGALYQYYYELTFSQIDRYYSGQESRQLKRLFSLERELLAVMTLYRVKRFFKDNTDISGYAFPVKWRVIRRQAMKRMQEASTGEAVLEVMRGTRLGWYFADGSVTVEHSAGRVLYDACRRQLSVTVSPSVAFVAYRHLNRLEVRNIINIIEGIRYKLPADQIERIIIAS